MSVINLRFAPWHDKDRLSPSVYASLTVAVSKLLFHTTSIPDNSLDIAWVRTFVRSYAHDDAMHVLQALDGGGAKDFQLSPHELSVRMLTLQLAERLARRQDGLDVSVLVDLAVSYGRGKSSSLSSIFEGSCNTTPSLLEDFKVAVVPAFEASLRDMQSKPLSSIRKTTYVLSQLLGCGHSVVMSFVQNNEFVLTLAKCYRVGLDTIAASRGGIKFNTLKTTAAWERDWLYTKTSIIDSFHAIVQTLLESKLHQDRDHLFSLLFAILELPSSSTSESTDSIPFISQSLLADYEYSFNLSAAVNDKFRGEDDARVDLLAATLADFSPSPHGPKPAGGLSALLKGSAHVRKLVSVSVPDTKGETTATNQYPQLQKETALDLAISQVLDIFPTLTSQHIRRCLQHPAFDGNPERLISSLLEEALPPELIEDVGAAPESVAQPDDFTYTKHRSNVWDEHVMDYSKLRIGKSPNDANTLLQDRSFIEQMKSDIIRRAEELSDEEDNVVTKPRERIIAYEDDLDDDLESLVDKGVKVAGDGEESDDEDDTEDTPLPETILELAYLDNPKLLDRDAATRRSKARAELKAKTGWGDEQIEGWRIMLERNPRKQKILQKHEFSGNISLVPSRNDPQEPSSSREGSSQPRRGGEVRGRGRGGSRGAEGGTTRDRAWKDKNKAKNANHNRKRGHDKKMAPGGVPPS